MWIHVVGLKIIDKYTNKYTNTVTLSKIEHKAKKHELLQ